MDSWASNDGQRGTNSENCGRRMTLNKALQLTANPLRGLRAAELSRYTPAAH